MPLNRQPLTAVEHTMGTSASIDPHAAGRQLGFLAVGSSSGNPIHSAQRVPYAQISRGHGRTIVIVSHAQPDSMDAAIVTAELMRELQPAEVRGCVRLISPFTASFCQQELAMRRAITEQVLTEADLVIELGAELSGWDWCETAITQISDQAADTAQLAEQARTAFGASMSLRLQVDPQSWALPDICLDEDHAAKPVTRTLERPGSLADVCRLQGIAHLTVCTGNTRSGTEHRDMLRAGCRNALVACEVLPSDLTLRASRLFRCQSERDSVLAPAAGILQMLTSPGRDVYRGDVMGQIIDPSEPWRAPVPVAVPRNGVVIACKRGSIVVPGEGIALLADEIQG